MKAKQVRALNGGASRRLRSLLDNSDEAFLDRNPIYALYRGDTRRAARHGDYISQAYVDAERQAAESDLAQLARITDPRFTVPSARALADRYAEIGRRVDATLPRLFDLRPKTPLELPRDESPGVILFSLVTHQGEGA